MHDPVAGTEADGASGGRMLRDPPLAAVRSALGARHEDQTNGLREAVWAYVDAARKRGEPVERIIIHLKYEMNAAGMIDRYSTREDQAVAACIVRWCIERFYEPTDLRQPDGR